MIVMDGPGPLAKLLTQRERRKGVVDIDIFNPLQFTPGTELMNDLHELLCNYAALKASKLRVRILFEFQTTA